MKVINVMSSKILGGVEQAFLDYNESLSIKGYEVFALYNKYGKIKGKLKILKNVKYIPSIFIKPFFLLFPIFLLKVFFIKPDIIIVQSRKVISLFYLIGKILKIPVILVCHNSKTTLLNKSDYIFTITQNQKDIFIKNGIPENNIFVIPNFLTKKVPFKEINNFYNPPIFGVMGRFDPAKGFPTFIEACAKLNNKGINFVAKIGGTPQYQYINEYKKIKYLIDYYRLQKKIELIGWVDKKEDFYNSIDVFVLPSREEPFGIVLLEAMIYSKPIISSNATGPNEILTNKNSALMFNIGNADDLAYKMEEMLNNIELAKKLAKNGYELVNKEYSIDKISISIDTAIKKIINGEL